MPSMARICVAHRWLLSIQRARTGEKEEMIDMVMVGMDLAVVGVMEGR